jgi:integrase
MAKQNRIKTIYPGVVFIEGHSLADPDKPERIYYIRYRKDGKAIEEKVGRQHVDDMTPARAARIRAARIQKDQLSNEERREAERAAKEAEDSRWTVARLWDQYRETFSGNKVIHHESRKFDNYLRATFGPKEPKDILPLDVDRLRIRLQKEGKVTTAARVLELLRRTINFGVKRGLILSLPFKIEVPRLNNETTEDVTDDELRALIVAMDDDPDQTAANVMRLALLSGMRRSEILKLRWEDLDFNKGFIRLIEPKGGRDQTIPMNDAVRSVLEKIERRADNPYVFPGKIAGTHLTDCRKSFERIRDTAGLPKSFRPLHGLRHVYASMLASSGAVDMYTLQRLLTHKSSIMTARYAHLRDDALRKASELAGSIVEQALGNGTKEKEHAEVVRIG